MRTLSLQRALIALVLALAVVGTAGACTDSGGSDDAPSQQAPAPGGDQDDDGDDGDDDG